MDIRTPRIGYTSFLGQKIGYKWNKLCIQIPLAALPVCAFSDRALLQKLHHIPLLGNSELLSSSPSFWYPCHFPCGISSCGVSGAKTWDILHHSSAPCICVACPDFQYDWFSCVFSGWFCTLSYHTLHRSPSDPIYYMTLEFNSSAARWGLAVLTIVVSINLDSVLSFL